MPTNDFLTFAGDPAANVMTQAQYADAGFTQRILGFSAGTAISTELNKAWRQAALMAHVVGQFSVDWSASDMLDDATPAGITALETHFTTAVRNVALNAVGSGYLPLTGGQLSGNLTVNSDTIQINAPATHDAWLVMGRPAGRSNRIQGLTGLTARWQMNIGNLDQEQGSDTGSNFTIQSFHDIGTPLDTPLSINRATGVVNFSHTPTVNGANMPFVRLAGGDVMTGTLGVGGNGISYNGLGPNYSGHKFALGWDGTSLLANVDGTGTPGAMASQAFVTSTVGNYVSKNGDTMPHGSLSITEGGLYAGGWSGFGGGAYFGSGDFALFTSGTTQNPRRWKNLQWQGNWWDYFDGENGNRVWASYDSGGQTTFSAMVLDWTGNLWTHGSINAYGGRILSSLDNTTPGAVASVCAYNVQAQVAVGFWCDHSGMYLGNMDGAGNPYLNSAHMLIDVNGYVSVWGNMAVSNNIDAHGMSSTSFNFSGKGDGSPGQGSGTSRGSIWGAGNAGTWRILGDYSLAVPNQHQSIAVNGYGNPLCYITQYYPGGDGCWRCYIDGSSSQQGGIVAAGFASWSDGSAKENVETWTAGLDAVLGIEPISFEYTPESGYDRSRRRHFGVTAQQLERVLPEAVVRLRFPVGVDDDQYDEALGVESATVVWALVNAMKEVVARLAVAEATIKSLKGDHDV